MLEVRPCVRGCDPVRHMMASLTQENHEAHEPRVDPLVGRMGVFHALQ